jgi:ribosome-binding factor A
MIAEYKRCERIADLLQREIADLLLRRVKDPRVDGVTLTGVKVSADLQHARIFYCVMGSSKDEGKEAVAGGLEKAKGFMRQELGKRLHMRYVPQLEFIYDTSFDYGDRIERLLKELHKDE